MKRKYKTLLQAINESIKIWTHISETGDSKSVTIEKLKLSHDNMFGCPLCQYQLEHHPMWRDIDNYSGEFLIGTYGPVIFCMGCPLRWKNPVPIGDFNPEEDVHCSKNFWEYISLVELVEILESAYESYKDDIERNKVQIKKSAKKLLRQLVAAKKREEMKKNGK